MFFLFPTEFLEFLSENNLVFMDLNVNVLLLNLYTSFLDYQECY